MSLINKGLPMSYKHLLFLLLCSFYSVSLISGADEKFFGRTLNQIARFWDEDGKFTGGVFQEDDDEQEDSQGEEVKGSEDQEEAKQEPFFELENQQPDPRLTYDQLKGDPEVLQFDESGLVATVSHPPFECRYFENLGCNKWITNDQDELGHILIAHGIIAVKMT